MRFFISSKRKKNQSAIQNSNVKTKKNNYIFQNNNVLVCCLSVQFREIKWTIIFISVRLEDDFVFSRTSIPKIGRNEVEKRPILFLFSEVCPKKITITQVKCHCFFILI